ncbi:unnamed protein product [Adineta steineri]|uniref:Uncharacterized protein n=1 Tax=Adineta steineri TaxID=433720 RepID=A0A819QDB0_9BILA|nr:unnamed protein product [Adineta steineri]
MASSNYMFDRELGSARAIINAYSNVPLTQQPQYNTYLGSYGMSSQLPYTTTFTNFNYLGYGTGSTESIESKKVLVDLQGQVRLLKKELENRDARVLELTSMKDAYKHVHFEPDRYGSTHDLRETTIKLAAKDDRINELKKENDLIIHANYQLRLRVHELESNVNSYDSVSNKSTLAISSIQKDAKEKQDQLLELEARVRTHMEEREASERKMDVLQKKLQELFAQLSVTLEHNYGQPSAASFETVMSRIADINAENILLKGKLVKIEDTNKLLEKEAQSNRATIQQMANQLQSHVHYNINHCLQNDTIKAERDAALHDKETVKTELETVKSRLDSIQKAWQNTRSELDQRENKYSSHELHMKQLENDAVYVKSCFNAFKQQIGQMLSDGYVKVEPKEEEIKQKIQLLMQSSRERGIIITNLENQKEQLTKQLQAQIDINVLENAFTSLSDEDYEVVMKHVRELLDLDPHQESSKHDPKIETMWAVVSAFNK